MFIPNYEEDGRITSIQNVTSFQTNYTKYWKALDVIKKMDRKSFDRKTRPQKDALQAMLEFYHKKDNPFNTLENRD